MAGGQVRGAAIRCLVSSHTWTIVYLLAEVSRGVTCTSTCFCFGAAPTAQVLGAG